tara:strand:- start:3758 stop:3946 length:189 start_codon:yes stop_codon:yes gene_type:complete
MKELLFKNYKFWRGRAGAYAKHKNINLNFANSQTLRYAIKYCELLGMTESDIFKEIKHLNYK